MSTVVKQTVCVAAGLATVAAAAWFLAVRSVSSELAALKAKASLQRVALAGAPTLAQDHPRVLADLEARIARAHAIIAQTPAPEVLYDAVQNAAKAANVRIEHLEPSSVSQRPIDLTRHAGFKAQPTQFDMEVTGEFDAVVTFLARLERDFGLSKITAVRVQPLPGQLQDGTKVTAQISTAHFNATAADAGSKPAPMEAR